MHALRGGAHPAVARAVAPLRLSETGLYADFAARTVAADVHPYEPQYPLWTDGAAKRRWIRLPAGASIDGSDPDAWEFPVGTRLWKEFAFERRVETRYMERGADGEWLFATYAWDEEEKDAVLAPDGGIRGARHDIPSRQDCTACHGNHRTPVLGFTALQLSPDRDPLAPNARAPESGSLDLPGLVARGLLRGADDLASRPPRIEAATPRERAALGYLSSNCGICHTSEGPLAPLRLHLDFRFSRPGEPGPLETTAGVGARFRMPGPAEGAPTERVHAGDPARSLLFLRLSSENPSVRMPPLGTRHVDAQARDLIEAWIREDLAHPPAPLLSKE